MQQFFFESPWLLGILGTAIAAAIGLLWTQTGHKAALYSSLAAGTLTAILTIVNIQVLTDRERIREVIHDVSSALQRNDREQVYAYIHPNAVEALQRARAELPRYQFEEARVTRIKDVMVNPKTTPPTAIAEFHVRVRVAVQGQTFRVARFVRVYFMLREDTWLVRDYEHFEPTVGFRDSSSNSR